MDTSDTKTSHKGEEVSGVWFTIAAFFAWGILPLYWKALREIPSSQILAHRILWSFLFTSLILFLQKRRPELKKALTERKNRVLFFVSAFTIGINWFVYIWAVNAGYVVETSMGYFINPLVSILLGMLFLKERLRFWQGLSVLLAFIGVLYMTFQYGKLPWIALTLAFSFGFYGLLRKTSRAASLVGLFYETALLSPLALAYIIILGVRGDGSLGSVSAWLHVLLICSGIVTATPLIWFALGARRIPLRTVGFTQYLAPSLQLFLGVVVFKEPFGATHLISFALIWSGLLLYSLSHAAFMQRAEQRFRRNSG
jgi:chloramphenicol-sensitive protein RarD